MKKQSVLLVGCGNIAGGFDLIQNEFPLTHAQGFAEHDGFKIEGCIDPDIEKLKSFQKRWGIPNIHKSLEEVESHLGKYDVISICNPTKYHYETLQLALKLEPGLVFCEKPITDDYSSAQEIINKFMESNILLAVNLTRRWMLELENFKKDLLAGRWGKLRSVIGHYNKGLLNNGIHLIDLIQFFLGSISVKWTGDAIFDFFDNDPSIPATLHSNTDIPIYLNTTNAKDYSFFELIFYAEKAVISLENGGLNWRIRNVEESKEFIGYKTLGETKIIETDYKMSMQNAIANIYDALVFGDKVKSDGLNALAAHRICDQIKKAK